MGCKKCAFSIKGECGVLKKKDSNCFAACYTLEDLKQRYEDMIKYADNHMEFPVRKEYEKYKKNLKLKK
jgi:hypothetical protein